MLAKTPDFPGFLRLQPFDLALPKRRNRELVGGGGVGGGFEGHFSPRIPRHGHLPIEPSTANEKSPTSVPGFPRSLLSRSCRARPRSGRIFQGMAHIDAAGRPAADGDCSGPAVYSLLLGLVACHLRKDKTDPGNRLIL
jgi:hypothetical protein